MSSLNLLKFKANTHSKDGEDGIIEAIFSRIGARSKTCCEFGAWDGIHLSNCRKLIQEGWSAVMIEGDKSRFDQLVKNYADNPRVTPVNCFVDAGENSLSNILRKAGSLDLDFLSIDIDGFDYEIFQSLDFRPRVICIEVNAGHSPHDDKELDREIAKNNVGQPFQLFFKVAEKRGYDLVCYNGNAFFVDREERSKTDLPSLTCEQAYKAYLEDLPKTEREFMYLVNLGYVFPFYKYHNSYLDRESLKLSAPLTALLKFSTLHPLIRRIIYKIRLVLGQISSAPSTR